VLKKTNGGNADTPMLECQIKVLITRQEVQDLPSRVERGLAATDAFKVSEKKNAPSGGHDYEIATIPGYMGYGQEYGSSESRYQR
jgi:hypothetical protein